VGVFVPHLEYLLSRCWISVIEVAIAAWRRRAPIAAQIPARGTMLALLAFGISLIAWPLWNQVANVDLRTYPAADDRAALSTIKAHEYVMLSDAYLTMNRYADAVAAAQTSIALNPAMAAPWMRVALACIPLGRRDEALRAATTAVRLAPRDIAANALLAELQARR
jgi:cytochrome c-type biogenesis protein CcmH/NrfG